MQVLKLIILQEPGWRLVNAHVDVLMRMYPDSQDVLRLLINHREAFAENSPEWHERCQLAILVLKERREVDKLQWPHTVERLLNLDELEDASSLKSAAHPHKKFCISLLKEIKVEKGKPLEAIEMSTVYA